MEENISIWGGGVGGGRRGGGDFIMTEVLLFDHKCLRPED